MKKFNAVNCLVIIENILVDWHEEDENKYFIGKDDSVDAWIGAKKFFDFIEDFDFDDEKKNWYIRLDYKQAMKYFKVNGIAEKIIKAHTVRELEKMQELEAGHEDVEHVDYDVTGGAVGVVGEDVPGIDELFGY